MGIITIIGTDLVGKTTIAKGLAKTLNYKYYHEGPPPKNIITVKDYTEYWEDILIKNGNKTIYDRSFYCEIPYSEVLKRNCLIDRKSMYILEKLMKQLCPPQEVTVIWVVANPQLIRKRYDLRGDDLLNYEQIIKIQKLYRNIIKESLLNVSVLEVGNEFKGKNI